MTFTIYASEREAVEKRLSRIAKKAEKYGAALSYVFGNEYPREVKVYAIDYINQREYVARTFFAEAVDVEISGDSLIRANGWTAVARCEHGENENGEKMNIVTPFDGAEVPLSWYHAAPYCEHCRTKRERKITYFCRNENGDVKQVGSTCLHDYTGILPETAAAWAEVTDILDRGLDCTEEEFSRRGIERVYPVADILAAAVDSIEKNGYRAADKNDSTRADVIERLRGGVEASENGKQKAENILAWLDSYNGIDNLVMNCKIEAARGYEVARRIGRLVYSPVAYEKETEREKQKAKEKAANAASKHVGAVGERIKIKAQTARLITSWETVYGYTFLYKFTDDAGNIFVWFASSAADVADGVTVTGTVKAHGERDGVKQTTLTRCKLTK